MRGFVCDRVIHIGVDVGVASTAAGSTVSPTTAGAGVGDIVTDPVGVRISGICVGDGMAGPVELDALSVLEDFIELWRQRIWRDEH